MIQRSRQTAEAEIADLLKAYEQLQPDAKTKSYRYSSGSIRIRIIDPRFDGLSRIERNDDFWEYMQELSDESHSQISMIVLVAPAEVESSPANYEFEHPSPSTL